MRLALFATLIVTFSQLSYADCAFDLRGRTVLSVVPVGELYKVASPDRYKVRDKVNGFRFDADLENGELSIDARLIDFATERRSALSGEQLYAETIAHFGPENIDRIKATWVAGVNRDRFVELRKQGLSIAEAAQQTWSGKMAARFGFTDVENFQEVDNFGFYLDFVRPHAAPR